MNKWSLGSLLVLALATVVYLASCSDSGGRGGADVPQSGTVAVLLADGPADEYDEIVITVTEAKLIPLDGDGKIVTLFESDEGVEVDLLDYRDDDFILSVKDGVPTGLYSKIRLGISDLRVTGGPCEDMDLKLPSGRIDLNPRQTIEVVAGETLSIRLDVDADKSINLHPAGNSGKCIFRPVVFVEVERGAPRARCPRGIQGTITDLTSVIEGDDDNGDDGDDGDDGNPSTEQVVGFRMDLRGDRGEIEVEVDDETVVFDGDGAPAGSNALAVGQDVRVWGKLDDDGHLEAEVVVIGDVLGVNGTVASIGDDGVVEVDVDAGEAIVGTVSVELTDSTFVLAGCFTRLDPSVLREGVEGTFVGKYLADDNILRAVAIFVRFVEIEGDLVAIDPADGGSVLTVELSDDSGGSGDDEPSASEPELVEIFLPAGRDVYLEGDGAVPLDLLADLVACEPRDVRVLLEVDRPASQVALEVRVEAETVDGVVESVDPDLKQLVIEGQVVQLGVGATIYDSNGDELVSIADIIEGETEVRVFGLAACPEEEVHFYGGVVIVLPEDDDGDDGDSPEA